MRLSNQATPKEQAWLDRYAETCCTRRDIFVYQGRFYKQINRSQKRPYYGTYCMGWDWVKSEVKRYEASEKRREARELKHYQKTQLGAGI